MKAIVTGGMGFIGSALTSRLMRDGWEVVVIDTMEDPYVRLTKNAYGKFRLVKEDICFMNDWELEGVDTVFHFAAHFANIKSLSEPMENVRVNMLGTMAVLEFCRKNKVKNLVYASSSGVYGGSDVSVYTEDMSPKPATPYEVTKYSGEILCSGYCDIYGINFSSPRFFNVYGVGDVDGEFRCVIPNFFRKAISGQDIIVTGEDSSRDFSYIDDVIDAVIAGRDYVDGGGQVVYNIATGKETKIVDLANIIIKLVGSNSKIKVEPRRFWDNTPRRVGDTSRFSKLFKSQCENMRNVEQGLSKSLDWYREVCR